MPQRLHQYKASLEQTNTITSLIKTKILVEICKKLNKELEQTSKYFWKSVARSVDNCMILTLNLKLIHNMQSFSSKAAWTAERAAVTAPLWSSTGMW